MGNLSNPIDWARLALDSSAWKCDTFVGPRHRGNTKVTAESMKSLRPLLLFVFPLLAAACGGGGSAVTTTPSPSAIALPTVPPLAGFPLTAEPGAPLAYPAMASTYYEVNIDGTEFA